jgi:hypothetical protein
MPVTDDEIRLVLPADPAYGRVARVAAQGISHRLGMSWRAQQDLQMAVDETLVLLLRPEGSTGDITFVFTIEPDRLVIDAETTAGDGQHWVDRGARTRFEEIVAPTVDVHEVSDDGDRVHLEKARPH